MSEEKWESVAPHLDKVKIPGGWIYSEGDSICFVPEPDKCNLHNEYTMKCCSSCLKERLENGS